MINLIPPHARQHVKVEYWVRTVSVWLLLLSSASLIMVLLLIPSVALIHAQLGAYGGEYQTASEQNDFYKGLEESIDSANTLAAKLVDVDDDTLFTKLITDLESAASGSVDVESIIFQRVDDVVASINVLGNAPSRAKLVKFRDVLEAHVSFKSVELPLSNLAKDKDVSFSIAITVNNEISQ